jgi:hypothetical protein
MPDPARSPTACLKARARRVDRQDAKIADLSSRPLRLELASDYVQLVAAKCQELRYKSCGNGKRTTGTGPLRKLTPFSRQFVLRFRLKITGVMPFMQLT